ncbi:MAG: N-acetyl-alpha-D-glucosaminyl L-malate synthase BshA [bacterium]|nr:N-acetyl-alpha-D-glucosaminyl L-malate synthase BshA [bacterium]
MANPLKIGISCYSSAGGSGIVATEMGLALARRGHEVHFITSSSPFRVRECLERVCVHTVETMDYPLFQHPPYTLALAVKMHQVASYHGLDLLHVHYAIPHTASAILASQMGSRRIPVVTTLHGTDITLVGNHPSYHRITRFCIEQSDRVTAVSNWLAEETHRTFHTDKRIRIIPNFVNTETFKPGYDPELRRRFARDDELIMLHASNFRPVKCAIKVVDIFARVQERFPTRLLLAGDGPELCKVEHRIKELGLTDRVSVLGAWDDMSELLPLADLYLQPSLHESFGLAGLEATSAGVPVLITDNGGPGEFVRNGENGYLLNSDDLDAWVDASCMLFDDNDLRARVSANARARVLADFADEKVIGKYESLFQDLVTSKAD